MAASQFCITTISDFSGEDTIGIRKRCPSVETSNPIGECNADLASSEIAKRETASPIFGNGDNTIGAAYTQLFEDRKNNALASRRQRNAMAPFLDTR